MSVYFSTLAVVSILLTIYSSRSLPQQGKRFFFILVTATLIFVAGFRHYVGTDYGQYVINYEIYQAKDISILSQPALTIIARISTLIYDDYATWFFLMSCITIIPVMHTIKTESRCVWLSVVLYLFLGCWHFSFNAVKQCAAATILIAGYPLMRDRKIIKWCLICLIASTFHITALLMIPVYFLVNAHITWKRTLLIISVGILVLFSYEQLFGFMAILKQGKGVLSVTAKDRTNSVNLLRILVHCAPILLYVVFHRRYNTSDTSFCCLYNMSLLNAMLNIGSMNSVYLNRFCSYTNIFNILFIPMLFHPIRKKRTTFWVMPLALMFYFVFWAYDLYKGSSTVVFHWIFER